MPLLFRSNQGVYQIAQYPFIFPPLRPLPPPINGLKFQYYDTISQIGDYTIFSYRNDASGSMTNAIQCSSNNVTLYILAVGGGGGGGGGGGFYSPGGYYNGGGGGGGGGVLQSTIILNALDTVNIQVGSGGQSGLNGGNTSLTFIPNTANNIIAYGGGGGAVGSGVFLNGSSGGSGGGSNGINNLGGTGITNQGNSGSSGLLLPWTDNSGQIVYYSGGGGGGAGNSGGTNNINAIVSINSQSGQNYYGGDGITSTLPGISSLYPNIYWGGGGGGGVPETIAHDNGYLPFGGLGGGGGGGTFEAGGNGDISGVYFAQNGGGAGGAGGINTGGGGGGDGNNNGGGLGGSGIVLVATLTSNISMYLPVFIFTYTGMDQLLQIPYGYTKATIQCWGAGGATMGHINKQTINTGASGGGGYTSATFSILGNSYMNIIVGQGGVTRNMGITSGTNYGGGGNGNSYGGGGGGRSAVQLMVNNVFTEIITAGGGGGAGGMYVATNSGFISYLGTAGGGGGTIGGQGFNYNSANNEGGMGGTSTAGGMGAITVNSSYGLANGYSTANGNPGSKYIGGASVNYTYGSSGAGGGGYYGGGSGGCYTTSYTNNLSYVYGGGGGGSSYVNYGFLSNNNIPTILQGDIPQVANSTALPSYFKNIIGNGTDENDSFQTGSHGQPGLVIVTFS